MVHRYLRLGCAALAPLVFGTLACSDGTSNADSPGGPLQNGGGTGATANSSGTSAGVSGQAAGGTSALGGAGTSGGNQSNGVGAGINGSAGGASAGNGASTGNDGTMAGATQGGSSTSQGGSTSTGQGNSGSAQGGGGTAQGGTNNSVGGTGNTNAGTGGDPMMGSGGDMSGSGGTSGAISGLQIAANPNSTLSAIVTWTTDQAATSVVQFGADGYAWEISDDTMTTEHRVVVIGMRRETTYAIKASSDTGSGSVELEGEFTTGSLPDTIPVGIVNIHDTDRTQAGWTLMNVQKGDGTTSARSPAPPMAVIYDEDGEPVWYYIDGTINDRGGAVSTQLTDVGVLIGPSWNDSLKTGAKPREVDFEGNIVWECPDSVCGPTTSFSHHASKLPNGHYLLNEDFGSGTTSPLIHELDHDGNEVWSVKWIDLLPAPAGATGDWCHGNSISADLDNNRLWVNCRWVGMMQIDYMAKTKDWLIPAGCSGDGLGDFTYSPADSQFSDSHDPEFHTDDNTVLMFDNGGYSSCGGGMGAQYHSRAVEYKVDETNMTLTLNWEFPGSYDVPDSWYTDWYTPFWGDADRLENGNVLVAAGIRSPTVESRVFEVAKADGAVVWEFRFPPDYGVYRADRIAPPLVHPIQ